MYWDGEWAKALTLAVALSMAATPILLVLLTRLEKSSSGQARDADEIDEEQPRVIVAGFGRFGADCRAIAALQRGEDGDPRS
ncbi:glutathione-regulated potassium-efflux system protein KefC [Klebsiella pneumoniae]|uniref:Glutathione-regulated potassium-efflux system protein KefC n=1 Tax=Klebsiella pneumoniae TaxID=573 RepID=A0A378BBQ7_KLEPN|nr:glutathione-regulated potassium-efflux system protein KefC [Klebsiella pneumoniae]